MIPLLKRNISKESIMDNITLNIESQIANHNGILAQFKNTSIFSLKTRKLKEIIWNGTTYSLEKIKSIELVVHPTSFSIILNGTTTLSVTHSSREEMEELGFALFPERDNSFSFEFNGETFDNEYINSNYYKLVSFWEKDEYDLDKLINEWLSRIFKVKQD